MQVLEAIADQDANRQLQQVKNFITRKVDGIILVPKDAKTCIPMIKAANDAGIPIVLFNRPADKSDAKSVAVVADNSKLTQETVAFMVEQARKSGRKHKAHGRSSAISATSTPSAGAMVSKRRSKGTRTWSKSWRACPRSGIRKRRRPAW